MKQNYTGFSMKTSKVAKAIKTWTSAISWDSTFSSRRPFVFVCFAAFPRRPLSLKISGSNARAPWGLTVIRSYILSTQCKIKFHFGIFYDCQVQRCLSIVIDLAGVNVIKKLLLDQFYEPWKVLDCWERSGKDPNWDTKMTTPARSLFISNTKRRLSLWSQNRPLTLAAIYIFKAKDHELAPLNSPVISRSMHGTYGSRIQIC